MITETDVLIVGGGPTGLMAALCLAERGVRFRIVDKAPARSDKSRALVVHAKTLELFQRLGFADALVPQGRDIQHVAWHVSDHAPFEINLGDTGVNDTPYPYLLFVSQAETEAAMDAALAARGVAVERPVEVVSFTQDDSGVTAQLRGERGEETVRAQYLVGADGAHSIVRKSAGLRFDGAPYPQDFLLADAEVQWDQLGNALRVFLNERGVLLAFPMKGESRYRIIVSEVTALPPPEAQPTLDETQAMVSRIASVPTKLHDPHWLARFHLHHRGVDHYRSGRAFVAGDAAHIHSPVGGQGMNTGIQDSANLAWKLAAVLQGHASSKLLDSYEAERLPVGHRLLQITDRMFSLAATSSHPLIRMRDFVMPHILPFATATSARRARIFRFMSQLAIHYRESPIVRSQDSGFADGPRPGERAPDGPLRVNGTETTLFRQLTGMGHDLLVFGRPDEVTTHSLQGLRSATMHLIPDDAAELRRRYGVTMPSMYLIRPDGYVAFRCTGMSREPVEAFFTRAYLAG